MKIFCLSGLGADQKAFQYLTLHPDFELHHIPWLIPEKKETLQEYAQRMVEAIQINEEFLLMGLSFGGIVAQEMQQFIQPKHTILLSTVKNRTELPKRLKWIGKSKIHQLVPTSFYTNESFISYSFFRKIYNPKMPKFDEFFTVRDKVYLNWSINKVLQWKESRNIENFTHIHGSQDIVFPSVRIKHAKIIKNGTHLMVIQKAKEVSHHINKALEEL